MFLAFLPQFAAPPPALPHVAAPVPAAAHAAGPVVAAVAVAPPPLHARGRGGRGRGAGARGGRALAPGLAGGAGGGRGRARGYVHNQLARVALSKARYKAIARKACQRLSIASGSFQSRVASNAFGLRYTDKTAGSQRRTLWAVDEELQGVVDQRGSYSRDCERAIVSHVDAQALGVKNFLVENRGAGIAVVATLDDFQCWTQRPPGYKRRCEQDAEDLDFVEGLDTLQADGRSKRIRRLGRNVQMNFMNHTETILAIPEAPDKRIRGVELCCPAVGLAGGNWSTILHAWQSWSLCNGTQPGNKIDSNQVTVESLRAQEEKLLWLCKDSLSANLCLEGFIQHCAVASQGTQDAYSVCATNCMGHQIILGMKPTLDHQAGVCTAMVRAGNLWQSAKFAAQVQKALEDIAEKAEWRECINPPREMESWIENVRKVIKMSDPQGKLLPKEVDHVTMMINSDPSLPKLVHFHVDGRCRCGGRRVFKANMRKTVCILYEAGCPQTVLARWKGLEESSLFFIRGVYLHKFIPQALHEVVDGKDIEEAERKALEAARVGDHDFAAAKTIRAHKLVSFLDRDAGDHQLLSSALTNIAPQQYLNTLFATERKMREVIDISLAEPSNSDNSAVPNPEYRKALGDARSAVLAIISRRASWKVQHELTELFRSFRGPAWQQVPLTRNQVFGTCCRALCSLSSIYYRLDFRIDQPKFWILEACGSEYNQQAMDKVVDGMWQKRLRCRKCFDSSFSDLWLQKLRDPHRQRRSHAFLHRVLPTMPLVSLDQEMKHLLGTEIRGGRRRGRTLNPANIAKRTYQKQACLRMARQLRRVEKDVLRKHNITRAQFTRAMQRQSVLRRAPRPTGRNPQRPQRQRQGVTRAVGGWAMFRRTNKAPGLKPNTPEHTADMRRLGAVWRALDDNARRIYKVEAHAVTDREAQARVNPGGVVIAHAGARKRVRRQHAYDASDSLKGHAAWSAGARLSQPGLGLRPDLINTTDTDARINDRIDSLFGWNPRVSVNPATFPHEQVCSLQLGGMCNADAYCAEVKTFCVNLAGVFARRGIVHKTLPLHLRVRVPGCGDHEVEVLLGFKFGRGDFYGVVRVAAEMDAVGGPYFELQYKEIDDVGLTAICAPLHRLLHIIFSEGMVKDTVDVSVHKLRDGPLLDEFSYRPELWFSCDVDVKSVHPIPRNRPAGVWLPFGMEPSEGTPIAGKIGEESEGEPLSDPEGLVDIDAGDDGASEAELSSVEEGPGDNIEEPPDVPPAPPEPPVLGPNVGLLSYGEAPSSRSSCYICNLPIIVGEWRLEIRIRPLNSFRWCKFIHPRCSRATLLEHRTDNLRTAQTWANNAVAKSAEEQLMLDTVVETLSIVGGASGSGGPIIV